MYNKDPVCLFDQDNNNKKKIAIIKKKTKEGNVYFATSDMMALIWNLLIEEFMNFPLNGVRSINYLQRLVMEVWLLQPY